MLYVHIITFQNNSLAIFKFYGDIYYITWQIIFKIKTEAFIAKALFIQ